MRNLKEISDKLKTQEMVSVDDVSKMQAVLNDTIKAINSTNEKTRKQATAELKNLNVLIATQGKGLGKFQEQIASHLVKTIGDVEARSNANDASRLSSIAKTVSEQAQGITRSVLNEYSRRNPLVYTGLKLFDSLKSSMMKQTKTTKPLQQKQAELLDLQLEVAEKQVEEQRKPDIVEKKRSAPVVSKLAELKDSNEEQTKVLKDIYSTVTGKEAPKKKPDLLSYMKSETSSPVEEKKTLTNKEIAAANKELKKISKAQKMQSKYLEKEAKASEAIVKIEKERLQDEAKNALLEKTMVGKDTVVDKAPSVSTDGKEKDIGVLGQVLLGTFFGELLEHMMTGGIIKGVIGAGLKFAKKGLSGALTAVMKSGKVTGVLGKLAGKILLPLTVGLAAWDGYKAFNDDEKISKVLDKDIRKINITDRIAASVSGIVSSMIGGTIDSIASIFGVDFDVEGKMFSGILKSLNYLGDSIVSVFDTKGVADNLGRELSFGEKVYVQVMNSGTALIGIVLGMVDDVFDLGLKKGFYEIRDSMLAKLIEWKDKAVKFFKDDAGKVSTPARKDEVINWSKPKAVASVNEAKTAVPTNVSMNSNSVAVNQVKQSTNINNQVFQTKTISPRNTDTTVGVLSYR
jgi:hypothetical protein